jgi:hypothetical protein
VEFCTSHSQENQDITFVFSTFIQGKQKKLAGINYQSTVPGTANPSPPNIFSKVAASCFPGTLLLPVTFASQQLCHILF